MKRQRKGETGSALPLEIFDSVESGFVRTLGGLEVHALDSEVSQGCDGHWDAIR